MKKQFAIIASIILILTGVAINLILLDFNNKMNNYQSRERPNDPYSEGDFFEYTEWFEGKKSVYKIVILNVTTDNVILKCEPSEGTYNISSSELITPILWLLGHGLNLTSPPSGFKITDMGEESIETVWGVKVCGHYQVMLDMNTINNEVNWTASFNFWLYEGYVIRSGAGTPIEIYLTDTNVNHIIQ